MQNASMEHAEQIVKRNGAGIPGLEETRIIAKEGLIYGLPLVMNYVSAYELFVG